MASRLTGGRGSSLARRAFFVLLWLGAAPLAAVDEPLSWVGLTLAQMLERFGVPEAVYPARGEEAWQDDVVFVYGGGVELYVAKNRVWQAGVKEALGVKVGEPQGVIDLKLAGNRLSWERGYALYLPADSPWPLAVRFNVNEGGKVSEIYVYRVDF